MARKNDRTGTPSSKPASGGGVQFIDVPLTSSDKDRLGEMYQANEFTLEHVFDALDEGFKFGLRYDERNHTYVATLTDSRATPTRVLSGRGSSADKALAALLYRHLVILAKDWEADWVNSASNDFD